MGYSEWFPTYTFIAYKPSSSRLRGCFESDIRIHSGVREELLGSEFERVMSLPLEKGEDGYEFTVIRESNGYIVFSQGDHMPNLDDHTYDNNRIDRIYEEALAKSDSEVAAALAAKKIKEENERKAIEEEALRAVEKRERAQYELLKAKFEPEKP